MVRLENNTRNFPFAAIINVVLVATVVAGMAAALSPIVA